ncbi:MAG TPA: transcriptional regulator [Bacteroidetes bacterium]|nr:transcriptional regulator [Bacteroidota bacterium]
MNGSEICSVKIVNQKKVGRVLSELPDEAENARMAELFKALADPTRLRIVQALLLEELCVCDISMVVDVSVSAVSHQLRLLRSMHIVRFRKQGKMVYYSLDDEHISDLIEIVREHVREKN